MTRTCKICDSKLNPSSCVPVKEKMFGTHRIFNYYLCKSCNCLQIESPPDNITEYYPEQYYTNYREWDLKSSNSLKYKIRGKIAHTWLYPLYRKIRDLHILNFIYIGKLKNDYKILDVGCGKGDLLHEFSKYGFTNLTGIDPFLNEEYHSPSINLYKTELENMNGEFDFIIFNHSFEHIWEQNKTLKKTAELLSDKGLLLIRIPVLNYAFEKYKENWVQLDAPRHYFLHSENSFKKLCKDCKLEITHIMYDSTDFQFIGSEQFIKDIPLAAENSYYQDSAKSIFSRSDIKAFKHEAKNLNKNNRGDQASFFIKKVN